MTVLVVIKILLVGALLGGFIMFAVYRHKQQLTPGKKTGVIATIGAFILRVVLIGAVALLSFLFVTKFMA